MRARILGCGTSSGVPRIGPDWGRCDPREPRNRRGRQSILVEAGGTRILIDTSPDMREQLIAAEVDHVDAVIWTHDHADHTNGIDDLRQLIHRRGEPILAYARAETRETLDTRFGYIFKGAGVYPPVARCELLPDRLRIGDTEVVVVDQPHGRITTAGLVFRHGGRTLVYATDFHDMTAAMREIYRGADLWIVDALRRTRHPTHPSVDQVLGWTAELAIGRAVLVHMDWSMDYRTLAGELPAHVVPGFDGMEVEL